MLLSIATVQHYLPPPLSLSLSLSLSILPLRLWSDSDGPSLWARAVPQRQPEAVSAGHEDESDGPGRDHSGHTGRTPLCWTGGHEEVIDGVLRTVAFPVSPFPCTRQSCTTHTARVNPVLLNTAVLPHVSSTFFILRCSLRLLNLYG